MLLFPVTIKSTRNDEKGDSQDDHQSSISCLTNASIVHDFVIWEAATKLVKRGLEAINVVGKIAAGNEKAPSKDNLSGPKQTHRLRYSLVAISDRSQSQLQRW